MKDFQIYLAGKTGGLTQVEANGLEKQCKKYTRKLWIKKIQ